MPALRRADADAPMAAAAQAVSEASPGCRDDCGGSAAKDHEEVCKLQRPEVEMQSTSVLTLAFANALLEAEYLRARVKVLATQYRHVASGCSMHLLPGSCKCVCCPGNTCDVATTSPQPARAEPHYAATFLDISCSAQSSTQAGAAQRGKLTCGTPPGLGPCLGLPRECML